MSVSFTCEMCDFFPERELLAKLAYSTLLRLTVRHTFKFILCSEVFRGVPRRSGRAVPGFGTCRLKTIYFVFSGPANIFFNTS